MLAHDCTSGLQIIFALVRITVHESSPPISRISTSASKSPGRDRF
jgi:hypothetical protein